MKTSSFLVAFLLLVLSIPVHAIQTISGRVVSVSDGDTVTVLDSNNRQHRIRLLGIDAPERKQAFGQKSRATLSNMVAGKEVVINFREQDRFGRVLGKVVAQGRDINLVMVQSGMAWHYKQFERSQEKGDRILYATAEQIAREQRIGLWQEPHPIAPWDFRRR